MIPTIQIKDNFLNEKEFDILYNNLDKILLKPYIQKNKLTSGFRQEFKKNSDNEWLFEKIKKQFLHAYKSEGKTKYKPVIGKAKDLV